MSGPPPKPDDRRQRRNERPVLALPCSASLAGVVGAIVPAPPAGLSAPNVDAWRGFWASPLASAVDHVTDLPALVRLFRIYDQIDKLQPLFDAEMLVAGSMGQPVEHPYGKRIDKLKDDALKLEDRFGLNPKSRLQLGITIAAVVKEANEAANATKGLTPQWDDDDSDAAAAESVG